MNYLQTWTKQPFGQGLFGDQAEFELGLYVTLSVKIKLLNLSKIAQLSQQ